MQTPSRSSLIASFHGKQVKVIAKNWRDPESVKAELSAKGILFEEKDGKLELLEGNGAGTSRFIWLDKRKKESVVPFVARSSHFTFGEVRGENKNFKVTEDGKAIESEASIISLA